MKKTTLSAVYALLTGKGSMTDEGKAIIIAEIEKELAKGAEKAAANRARYEEAHDVVINGLVTAGEPVTVAELYELIKEDLPDGFSRSKVQYGLFNYWKDEIEIVGANPYRYKVKA